MGSTVKLRPNHYEVLGLTPGASGDEIAQAFAKALSDLRPRPFGSLAEVTVAYEILRDRSKREAYDISLGLKPKPKPPAPPPVVPQEWASLAMRASARPAPRPAMDPLPRPAPKAEAPPRPEPVGEPKISPFVAAASPSEPSNADFREPHPKPRAPAEHQRRPERAKPRLELPTGGDLLHFDESRRFQVAGADLSQWKIPALAAGVLILAVGLGAWTGLEAGNDDEQAQTENSVTLKVPAAKPIPDLAGSPLTPAPSMAEDRSPQPTRAAATRVGRSGPPLQIDLPEDRSGDAAQVGQSPADEIVIGQAPAEIDVCRSDNGEASASQHRDRANDWAHRLSLRPGCQHGRDGRDSRRVQGDLHIRPLLSGSARSRTLSLPPPGLVARVRSERLALARHSVIGAAVRDDPAAAAGAPRLDEAEIVAIFIAY